MTTLTTRNLTARNMTLALALAAMTSLAAIGGAAAQQAGGGGGGGGGSDAGNDAAGAADGHISRPQPLIVTHVPGTPPNRRPRRPRVPTYTLKAESDCGYHVVKRGAASQYLRYCHERP